MGPDSQRVLCYHHRHLSHLPPSWPLVSRLVYREMAPTSSMRCLQLLIQRERGGWEGWGCGVMCLPCFLRNNTTSVESDRILWSDVSTYCNLIFYFSFIILHLGKELFAKEETDFTYQLLWVSVPQFRKRCMLLLFSVKPWGPPSNPFSGSSKGCDVSKGRGLHSRTTGDRPTVV